MTQAGTREDVLIALFGAELAERTVRGEIAPITAGAYVADVAQLVGWLAGEGVVLREANASHLSAYLSSLAGTYRDSTVRRKWSGIRAFYAWACREGIAGRDPTATVRPECGRRRRAPEVKGIDRNEAHRLVRATGESAKGMRDRTILLLMAVQGLTVGEVAGLDLGDVDLEAGALQVTGKRGRERPVWLVPETLQQLRRWLRVRSLLKPPSEALFVSMHWTAGRAQPGNRLSCRGIRMMVDGYLEEVGAKRPGVSCQSLRQLYASLALGAGAELVAVAESLGHADPATTLRYKLGGREEHPRNPARLVADQL